MVRHGLEALTNKIIKNKSKTIMEILRVPVSEHDIKELACKILGLDIDAIDADTQIIEDKMAEEYFIDLDTFRKIIERFKGFADVKNKCWLIKTEVSA